MFLRPSGAYVFASSIMATPRLRDGATLLRPSEALSPPTAKFGMSHVAVTLLNTTTR